MSVPEQNLLPPCASGRYYRVKAGETLTTIASRVGISLDELVSLNPHVDPLNLQPGQFLCLPGETPCASGLYWEVAPGDTFYKIAREIGTTVERLIELNPFVDPHNLQVGQLLCLPES